MWTGIEGLLSRRDLRVFVPEGLMIVARHPAAASRPRDCLGCVQKRNRPVGHGMIGSDMRATIRTANQPWVRIRPFPTGRILD
jgi:hypothetical protein